MNIVEGSVPPLPPELIAKFRAIVGDKYAVTDAAELLRQFNRPDGVAHTMAEELAGQAVSDAERLTPEVIVARFTDT